MVSLCSACQDLLIDMHIDIFGHHSALKERKLTTKFDLDLSELTNHVSSVSMREKRRSNYCSRFFVQSFLQKKVHDNFGSLKSVLVI